MTGRRYMAAVTVAGMILAAVTAPPAMALDNGRATTPPMVWSEWLQAGCNVSEDVIEDGADALVSQGYAKAGYDTVQVDDCWQGGRDSTGELFSSPSRFPHGVKYLADETHAKGLQFGIYGTPGTMTCAGYYNGFKAYPVGSRNHERQDADTWAAQGVDYLKYDWCGADWDSEARKSGLSVKDQQVRQYGLMRDALKASGRDITYAISQYGKYDVAQWAGDIANMWRTSSDIGDSFSQIESIIDTQKGISQYSHPGAWNDPDGIRFDATTLTMDEKRTHFGMWCMFAAPITFALKTPLSSLTDEERALAQNPRLIAIDQDPLGQAATYVSTRQNVQLWTRPLKNGDKAIALFNMNSSSTTITVPYSDLKADGTWKAVDQFNGSAKPAFDSITVTIPAHGTTIWRLSRA